MAHELAFGDFDFRTCFHEGHGFAKFCLAVGGPVGSGLGYPPAGGFLYFTRKLVVLCPPVFFHLGGDGDGASFVVEG